MDDLIANMISEAEKAPAVPAVMSRNNSIPKTMSIGKLGRSTNLF